MRYVKSAVWAVFGFLLLPALAGAQGLGTIAGVARDASGAVLPGVTVEASSPALIEKSRSVVTNESGQYTIVSLPPGTYVVSFALPGFSTFKREGIELLANFTAQVNAEMKVGGVAETVEVTAETPLVDTQSSAVARAVTKDIIREIPTGGSMYLLASMMVGVNMTGGAAVVDVGGSSGSPVQAQLSAHGGTPGDEVQMVDGIKVGNMMSFGGRSNQTFSPLLFEQIDVQLSGHAGDAPTVGVQTNLIPRTGGNAFHGTFLANGTSNALQSNNLTTRLQNLGLTDTQRLKNTYDINGGFGGPIKRDRLWFFATGRYQTNTSYLPGLYFPKDPTSFARIEDKSRQGFDDQFLWDYTTRLTLALTSNMRLNGFIQVQHKWWNHWAINAAVSPEAVGRVDWPGRLYQLSWNWTASSKLLFEAGSNYGDSSDTILPRPGEINGLGAPYRVVEQGGTFNGQPVAPITYGKFGAQVYGTPMHQYGSRASMSYVTGAHSFKVGMDLQQGFRHRISANFADDIALRTQGFDLNQVTIFAPSGDYRSNLNYNAGLYVQDRWRIGRVAISPGMRFEFQKETNDAYLAGPTKYLPNRSLAFPRAEVIHWKDANPRLGVSYDVFGNGKTALKASAARGVRQDNINYADVVHPAVALSTSVARTVTDSNKNHIPDCDLSNPNLNGECGPWLTSGFGGAIPVTQWDPRTQNGWGARPWNWEFSTGVQHEVTRRVSAGLSYYRRIYGNFLVQDNVATTADDYKEFTVAVPTDSRLPTSGQKLTVYDVNPVLHDGRPFSTTLNVVKPASDFGTQYLHWNGFDATSNVRLQKITFQGGVTFGKTISDNCEIVKKVPEALLTNTISNGGAVGAATINLPREYCHNETGWQPTWKMIGTYDVPWQNIRFSSNFQSLPGPGLQAGVIYSSADLTAALGRGISGGGNKTVNVFDPNTAFGDRLYQLDLRFTKIIKVNERNTIDANFDIYNTLNSDAATAENQTYSGVNGGAWRRPTGVIQGRLFKFGVRWDF